MKPCECCNAFMEFVPGTPNNQEHQMVCPDCGNEREPTAEELANNQLDVEPDPPEVEDLMTR